MSDEKNNDGVQKVGPYLLKKVKPGPTSAGIEPTYALCTPDRWGLRYSDADPERRGQLMYPVARDYAKAMQTVLLTQVQWGNAYFGPADGNPVLHLQWPLDNNQARNLFDLIRPVMMTALTSPTGGFGLPEDVVPKIAHYIPENALEQGSFSPGSWRMNLNLSTTESIFKLDSSAPVSDQTTRNQQIKPLEQLADTIFHEARHCQQFFWQYAIIRQFPDNFKEIPNIVKLPDLISSTPSNPMGPANVALGFAVRTPLPTDTMALISLKRMAVGNYLYTLAAYCRANYIPPYLDDRSMLNSEYQRAKTVATDLLQHVGLGGTAIDVDSMVSEPQRCYCDYTERPWENDAFFCGDMATTYWRAGFGLLLKTYPEDRCSHAYELGYTDWKRTSAIRKADGNTNGGN